MNKIQISTLSEVQLLEEIVNQRQEMYNRMLIAKDNGAESADDVSLALIALLQAQLDLIRIMKNR